MVTLHFSIKIKARKGEVWKVLWDEDTFRNWASVFTEDSYIKTDWKEGGKFECFDSGRSDGSYGFIVKLIPNKFLSFKHIGELKGKSEHSFADGPRFENYTLKEENGYTRLSLDQDAPVELKDFFENSTPKAFERIKELAEK